MMDWQKVIDDLREQQTDAVKKAKALSNTVVHQSALAGDFVMVERVRTIERHRINGNFCDALASALEAGLS